MCWCCGTALHFQERQKCFQKRPSYTNEILHISIDPCKSWNLIKLYSSQSNPNPNPNPYQCHKNSVLLVLPIHLFSKQTTHCKPRKTLLLLLIIYCCLLRMNILKFGVVQHLRAHSWFLLDFILALKVSMCNITLGRYKFRLYIDKQPKSVTSKLF